MLPLIKTLDDIERVMKFNRRWRRRQRVLALRKCQKQVRILRMREEITPEQAASVNRRLLPMLKQEEQTFKRRGGDMDSLTPPVRRPEPDATEAAVDLAEEHEIDLSKVTGSGKDGRIVVRDVRELLDAQPA